RTRRRLAAPQPDRATPVPHLPSTGRLPNMVRRPATPPTTTRRDRRPDQPTRTGTPAQKESSNRMTDTQPGDEIAKAKAAILPTAKDLRRAAQLLVAADPMRFNLDAVAAVVAEVKQTDRRVTQLLT